MVFLFGNTSTVKLIITKLFDRFPPNTIFRDVGPFYIVLNKAKSSPSYFHFLTFPINNSLSRWTKPISPQKRATFLLKTLQRVYFVEIISLGLKSFCVMAHWKDLWKVFKLMGKGSCVAHSAATLIYPS